MPRVYTTAEKKDAMKKMAANNGSIRLTYEETGIPKSTLQHWWAERNAMSDADRLNELRQHLIVEAMELASHLKEVITEAPLNQRATALNQMIDKILKITDVLEEEHVKDQEKETPILRIEYVDEQGQIHSTAPDAENDSE